MSDMDNWCLQPNIRLTISYFKELQNIRQACRIYTYISSCNCNASLPHLLSFSLYPPSGVQFPLLTITKEWKKMKKLRKKNFTAFHMETKTDILLEIYIRVVVIKQFSGAGRMKMSQWLIDYTSRGRKGMILLQCVIYRPLYPELIVKR